MHVFVFLIFFCWWFCYLNAPHIVLKCHTVPEHEKTMLCLMENIHPWDKPPSGRSNRAVAVSPIINQPYVLNKTSSNRNTREICLDYWTKYWPKAHRNFNPVFPTRREFSVHWFNFCSISAAHHYCKRGKHAWWGSQCLVQGMSVASWKWGNLVFHLQTLLTRLFYLAWESVSHDG